MHEDVTAFIEEVNRLINPPKHLVLEYRIYYSEHDGSILSCSMVDHSDDPHYIVVDKDTYENYFRYAKVKDGKLIPLDFKTSYRIHLVKNVPYLQGEFRVVKNHSALILEAGEEYPNTDLYDRRPG
jgi:hypothetical protein